MSHKVYNSLWDETQLIIDEAIKNDTVLQGAKPEKDKELAHRLVTELYTQYTVAINKLEECYDQIVHPQKRLIIRKILDESIGRLLELKHDLVNLDYSEFSYYEESMIKFNITPFEVEINIPRYYIYERQPISLKYRKMIDDILKKLGFYEEEEYIPELTRSDAIQLIQIHERARQGRIRHQFMKEIRLMKEKSKSDSSQIKSLDAAFAALKIQKTWRGFTVRRQMKRRKMEEMLLIGMIPGGSINNEEITKVEKIKNLRRKQQAIFDVEYKEALIEIRDSIFREKGESLKEAITDEVRKWYMNYYKQFDKFPELPSEESGGSAVIMVRQGTESEYSKSTTGSTASRKSKRSSSKEKDSDKEEEFEDLGFKMISSNFLTELMNTCTDYQNIWKYKDESNNPLQKSDMSMIRTEKFKEIENELRRILDQMLRKELELLQAALDRDHNKKTRRPKKSGKKGGKKSKKKKEKDLTPDRTLDSLFEELVANGIIKKYPEVHIGSFIGERSYSHNEMRKQGYDPPPSLGDIRQLIKEYCILPLGNRTVHNLAPLVKSVLIAGPRGSGKHMLVNAICTEVGAILFDLTPSNLVGKYPGKSGLVMLMHLVNKVGRLLQPTVILIEDGEKPFMKKVPKTDKTDPKRLKKDLPKLVRNISTEDQMLVIGISRSPWDCDQKLLAQTYIKMVHIPRPDYSSLSILWKKFILQYPSISRQFDTAVMARLCDGYTVGSILNVMNDVMTCKRVLQLQVQPLTHAELINALSKYDPVYKEEDEMFSQWFSKTPIGRRKARALEIAEEEAAALEEQLEKKKEEK